MVGAVGGKLYYADKTIQHAGVVIGLAPTGRRAYTITVRNGKTKGFYGKAVLCAGRFRGNRGPPYGEKKLYEEAGGLDGRFAVSLNDVDFCLKLRQLGYLNVFTPFAELYHYESVSRGLDTDGEKAARYNEESAPFPGKVEGAAGGGDPYYNPEFYAG